MRGGPGRPPAFRCSVYLVPTNQLQSKIAIRQSINMLAQSGFQAPRMGGRDGLESNDEGDLLFVIEVSHCPDADQRMSALRYCDEKIITALAARSKSPTTNFWTGKYSAIHTNRCSPNQSANYYYYYTTNDTQKNNLRVLLMREALSTVNGVQEFMIKTFGQENGDVEFNVGTRTTLTYKIRKAFEDLSTFPRREFAVGSKGKAKAWSINYIYDLLLTGVDEAGKRKGRSESTVQNPAEADGDATMV